METHHTIGMAGHVDHGKTALTKALTGVDTDRLQEEKERGLSIEPGYASLELEEGWNVSIVDVPGHERFIRQMIAGVAGIDLVILVIAADEGVMPQTKEHMEIIGLLGVQRGIVALTKTDGIDEELLALAEQDAREALQGTVFEKAEIIKVDSITGVGLEKLKETIGKIAKDLPPRQANGPFRMPIDHVFTLKGHGLIARGTIQNGTIHRDEELTVLPSGPKTRVRQLQVHHAPQQLARAGQRTAINLSGLQKEQIKRGDLLVTDPDLFPLSRTVDLQLQLVAGLGRPVKQREAVRFHAGTRVVNGVIVFFDRNEAEAGAEILCQIRLEEEVAIKRGDRFIIRRPSPSETVGGGSVIDPEGERYRFGSGTIEMLEQKKSGKPEERLMAHLKENQLAGENELEDLLGMEAEATLKDQIAKGAIVHVEDGYVLGETLELTTKRILSLLEEYHEMKPLDQGMPKAELMTKMKQFTDQSLCVHTLGSLIGKNRICTQAGTVRLADFTPHPPAQMEGRVTELLLTMKESGMAPEPFQEIAGRVGIRGRDVEAVKHYLLREGKVYELTDQLFIHGEIEKNMLEALRAGTEASFSPAEAKEIIGVSRKYMIPYLESLDRRGITRRAENMRYWTEGGTEE